MHLHLQRLAFIYETGISKAHHLLKYAHHVACDGNTVLVHLKGTEYILPSLPLPLAYI
jgi:hypothetical protein